MWISAENVGSEPRPFRSTSDDVNEWATTTTPCDILWEIWVLYKKKRFCRNFKNPKKFWKSEKKWNSRLQNFEKIDLIILPNRTNRSNRKKSLNRLDRFIGQRINSHSAMTPFLGGELWYVVFGMRCVICRIGMPIKPVTQLIHTWMSYSHTKVLFAYEYLCLIGTSFTCECLMSYWHANMWWLRLLGSLKL